MRWERASAWQLAGPSRNDFLGARTLLGADGAGARKGTSPFGGAAKVTSLARAARELIPAETAKDSEAHSWTVAGPGSAQSSS